MATSGEHGPSRNAGLYLPKITESLWGNGKYFENAIKIIIDKEKFVPLTPEKMEIFRELTKALSKEEIKNIEYFGQLENNSTWVCQFNKSVDVKNLFGKQINLRGVNTTLMDPYEINAKASLYTHATYRLSWLPFGIEETAITRYFKENLNNLAEITSISYEHHKEEELKHIKNGNIIVKVKCNKASQASQNMHTGLCKMGKFVFKMTKFGEPPKCLICESIDHSKRDCPRKKDTCTKCGRIGHLAKLCFKADMKDVKKISNLPDDDESGLVYSELDRLSGTIECLTNNGIQSSTNNLSIVDLNVANTVTEVSEIDSAQQKPSQSVVQQKDTINTNLITGTPSVSKRKQRSPGSTPNDDTTKKKDKQIETTSDEYMDESDYESTSTNMNQRSGVTEEEKKLVSGNQTKAALIMNEDKIKEIIEAAKKKDSEKNPKVGSLANDQNNKINKNKTNSKNLDNLNLQEAVKNAGAKNSQNVITNNENSEKQAKEKEKKETRSSSVSRSRSNK
jgi:hypothetical protein